MRRHPMAKKKESDRKTYHVTPHPDGGWQVKLAGADRARSKHTTKKEAVAKAKHYCKAIYENSQVIVHKKDGKIETEYTYGDDPRRTKG
jgi:hypothetical protein